MSAYSTIKAAWHLDRIADLRAGRDINPTHLHFVISDLCNQDCHFCSYRMADGFSAEQFPEGGNRNPARFIPTAKALEILDDCALIGCNAIEFTGGGEPTVHPEFWRILAHAQGLGLETGLVTNGTRLTMRPELDRLAWLRVSLDAARAGTYEATRRSPLFDRVVRTIQEIGELKGGPYIGAGFVVTRENYREIIAATALVKGAGLSYIRLSAMFSHRGAAYYDGITVEIDKQRAAAREFADERFKVVDLFSARVEDLRQQAPDYAFCGEQQFVLYIGGDQKVYRCCTTSYTRHGEIGDLREQRFIKWLTTTRRYDFDARSCHHCQFNDKNRLINALVREPPQHVWFV